MSDPPRWPECVMYTLLDELPYWLRKLFVQNFDSKWSHKFGKWEEMKPEKRGELMWEGEDLANVPIDDAVEFKCSITYDNIKFDDSTVLERLKKRSKVRVNFDGEGKKDYIVRQRKKNSIVLETEDDGTILQRNSPTSFSAWLQEEDYIKAEGPPYSRPDTTIRSQQQKICGGKHEEWDVTILTYELLYSSHKFYTLKMNGREVLKNESDFEAFAIFSAKNKRNFFCHSSSTLVITKDVYEDIKKAVKLVVERCFPANMQEEFADRQKDLEERTQRLSQADLGGLHIRWEDEMSAIRKELEKLNESVSQGRKEMQEGIAKVRDGQVEILDNIRKLREDLIQILSTSHDALSFGSAEGEGKVNELARKLEQLQVTNQSAEVEALLSRLQNKKASISTLRNILHDDALWNSVLTLGETLRRVDHGVKRTQERLGEFERDAKRRHSELTEQLREQRDSQDSQRMKEMDSHNHLKRKLSE
eukprot:g277.t1